MPIVPLKLPPGVNAEWTPTLNESRIASCDMIRFKSGLVQKLGGWSKFYPFAIPSTIKELAAWKDLTGDDHLAVGATESLSVITDGVSVDITPQTLTSDTTPDFSTTSTSATVDIVDTNIDTVTIYDAVFFNTPVSVGGIILQGLYPIINVTGATSYQITAGEAATATEANGGTVPGFNTTSGSATVRVTLADHAQTVGSIFTFPISTTVGGVTMSGSYKVTGVVDADNFQIAVSATATSTTSASMNGGNAQLLYYIALGPEAGGSGYGIGGYGLGGYGTGIVSPVQTGTPITTTDWTLANWGEILLSCPKGGAIYQWTPNSGFLNAQIVTGAPVFNTGIFVAMPEQILVAYGSTAAAPGSLGPLSDAQQQDPLIVRWSDILDFTNFQPTSATQAGSFHIPRGSRIVGGLQGPQQALIWTDLGVWAMSYLGPPYVFGFNELGSGCGLIGQHAAATMRGLTFWMGTNSFFVLSSGGVQNMPCSVWDVVFQDIDENNQHKCRAAPNSSFDEIWWFYPSASGGTGENDKYVKYNLNENAWDYGNIGRTAWIDQSILGQPIGSSPQGVIYQHEVSMNADGQPLSPTFTTGYFVLTEGHDLVFGDWIFPDMRWGDFNGSQNATVYIVVNVRDYPNGVTRTYGPFTMTAAKEYINCRFRGRQISLTFYSNDLDTFWRMGNNRIRVASDGQR